MSSTGAAAADGGSTAGVNDALVARSATGGAMCGGGAARTQPVASLCGDDLEGAGCVNAGAKAVYLD